MKIKPGCQPVRVRSAGRVEAFHYTGQPIAAFPHWLRVFVDPLDYKPRDWNIAIAYELVDGRMKFVRWYGETEFFRNFEVIE